jgi:hypothetical protein
MMYFNSVRHYVGKRRNGFSFCPRFIHLCCRIAAGLPFGNFKCANKVRFLFKIKFIVFSTISIFSVKSTQRRFFLIALVEQVTEQRGAPKTKDAAVTVDPFGRRMQFDSDVEECLYFSSAGQFGHECKKRIQFMPKEVCSEHVFGRVNAVVQREKSFFNLI